MSQKLTIFPYIERLLQGAEVVWKPLGEVAEISAGNSAPQDNDLFTNGVYPFCRTSDVGKVHHSINFHQIQDKLNEEGIKGLRLYKKETILLPKSGASTLLNHRVMLTIDSYVSSHLATIYRKEEVVLAKFLFYFLSKFDIAELVPDKSYPSLKVSEIAKIQIPLPPLSVQQEIVRILDKFTELEAELEAELDCRKRQYEYYRNKLLTFNELENGGGVEIVWKTLGEVAIKIYSGGTPKTGESEYWEKGMIPWMSSGEVNLGTIYQTEKFITEEGLANSSAKFVPVDSLVIALAGQGKTRGKVARIKIKLTTNQSLAALTFESNKVCSDYVYHYMVTQYEKLRQISSGSGTRGGLNLQMISNFPIPLPPLSEQQRIATILDKFDTLVNSISEGLPKEIALRRKQYEYYREQLLRF